MDIPNELNPLAADLEWIDITKNLRKGTWRENELEQLGIPYGGLHSRNCVRDSICNIVCFGYDYQSTTITGSFQYGTSKFPPRYRGSGYGAPFYEIWCLNTMYILDIKIKYQSLNGGLGSLDHVRTTKDNWQTYETCPFEVIGKNTYHIQTTEPVQSMYLGNKNGGYTTLVLQEFLVHE